MNRLIILVLALGIVVTAFAPVVAHAAPQTTKPKALKSELAELVRFAHHNLNLDPRASSLTPRQRQQALVESLLLYGIRFPEPERLRPGMNADEIADVLLKTLSMKDRSTLASVARVFLSGLRGTATYAKPFGRKSRRLRPMANQG